MPFVFLFASLEYRFRCIQTVRKDTDRQARVFLFYPFRQSFKCFRLTVIFADIFCLIFYEFRSDTDDQAISQHQFCLQHMVVIDFFFFCCTSVHHFLQAVGTVPFRKMEQACGIKDQQPVLPEESHILKFSPTQKHAYHVFSQPFQFPCFQPGEECIKRYVMWQEFMGLYPQDPAQVLVINMTSVS